MDIAIGVPYELSFCGIESISPIHGALSEMLAKGPLYDGNAYKLGESLSAKFWRRVKIVGRSGS